MGITVISGVPGAGKTTACKQLAAKGCFYVSLNGEDRPSPADRLRNEIRQAYSSGWNRRDPTTLMKKLDRVAGHVVVEWGFPVASSEQREISLMLVREMRNQGARFVWFECDDEPANLSAPRLPRALPRRGFRISSTLSVSSRNVP